MNRTEYDVSSLLYLNNQGEDFDGGAFVFNDCDGDRLIEPTRGRLVFFGSGEENMHQASETLHIWQPLRYHRNLG